MTVEGIPLKYVSEVVAGQSPLSTDVSDLEQGQPFLQGNAEFGTVSPTARYECDSAPKVASTGDLLLSVRAPVGALNIADKRYGIGRGLCAIRPHHAYPQFLWWWLHHARQELNAVATGSTFEAVSAGQIGALRVPRVSLETQRKIAGFLDRETAQIDAVIAKQEELVGLLGERRSAVIAHAVTKGLNPQAPMKDSGFEWLGDVPGHWRVVPLKRVLDRVDQGVSPQAWAELAEDGGWGVLKSGCMNWGKFRETEHKALDPDFDIDPTIVVAEGDFVVSRASGSPNLVGSAAIVRSLSYKLILSDKTFRLVFAEGQESGYYYWAMNSTAYREQVKLAISGADGLANNLPLSSLRRIVIPLPPSSEQAAIAHHLNGVVGAIDTVMTKANDSIALMRERRAALISDAVTGRLDIESYGRGRSEEGVA